MEVKVQDSINQDSKDFSMVTICQFSSIQISQPAITCSKLTIETLECFNFSVVNLDQVNAGWDIIFVRDILINPFKANFPYLCPLKRTKTCRFLKLPGIEMKNWLEIGLKSYCDSSQVLKSNVLHKAVYALLKS